MQAFQQELLLSFVFVSFVADAWIFFYKLFYFIFCPHITGAQTMNDLPTLLKSLTRIINIIEKIDIKLIYQMCTERILSICNVSELEWAGTLKTT